MKKAIILVMGLIMLAGNVYAAGDLAVEGKVGIGTSTPSSSYKLDIQNGNVNIERASGNPALNLRAHNDAAANSAFVKFFRSRSTEPLSVQTDDALGEIDVFGYDGVADKKAGSIKMQVDGAVGTDIVPGKWVFSTMNSSGAFGPRMTIKSNGNVGIGQTDPEAYRLYVNGDLYVTGTAYANVVPLSDANYKDNVASIETPLAKVLDLEGVTFTWKKEAYPEKNFPDGRHYGVIAQQVENVLPEVVRTGPEGGKAVAYTEIIPVLIEAIKAQQAQISALRAEVERLKQGR